jgi:hypothetical protein
MALYRTMVDGSPVSPELASKIASFGVGLFQGQVKSVTFASLAEAIAAAEALGYVAGSDPEHIGMERKG